MMLRKICFMVVLTCVASSVGCDMLRARSLRSQIKDLESQKDLSQQRLDGLKQEISSLRSQSNVVAGKLQARRSEVMTYMGNHKMAIGCMTTGGYILKGDNVFSEDVEEVINGIGWLCLGGVLFSEGFRQEIADAVTKLDQASTEIEDFQSQIDSLKPKIDVEMRAWTDEKATFDALSEKSEALQSELKQLE